MKVPIGQPGHALCRDDTEWGWDAGIAAPEVTVKGDHDEATPSNATVVLAVEPRNQVGPDA
jgi:hypothetical protein